MESRLLTRLHPSAIRNQLLDGAAKREFTPP